LDVTPCSDVGSLHPADGGSKFLTVGILPHHYTVSQPRRPLRNSKIVLFVRFLILPKKKKINHTSVAIITPFQTITNEILTVNGNTHENYFRDLLVLSVSLNITNLCF
jgi:hypothetical protein